MNTAKAILFSLVRITLLIHLPTNLNAEENERWFQFGLFPPISSNGINSEKITTSVSINLIGGYNAGNKILELGSLWNASKRYTKGIQIAGIVNYTGCSHNAVQISSFANIAASGNSPLQFAGLLNIGQHISGLQTSALANVAKTVTGVQLGLINYMEDGDKGVSIGLINIAKHRGKYEFEVSFSESINTAISFKIGTDKFYTIFSGGINYFLSTIEYAAGLGFGTNINWKKRWSNQIEIQAFGISSGKKFTDNSANSIIQLMDRLVGRLQILKIFPP